VVFEDLKHFHPKGGKHNSGLKQRFQRWLHRLLAKRAALMCEEQGIKVAYIYPRGTSSWAYDGSGEVVRDKKNYALALFASGKRFNADLNAALNIAARFIAKMLGVTAGDRPAAETGKSSGSASRMPIVLADVWRHAGAPVYEVH
jgi:transposase